MTDVTRLIFVVAAASWLAGTGGAAHAQALRCTLDRTVYIPAEPIVVALVYCPDSSGVDSVLVPPLHPQAGYLSLTLLDAVSGHQMRMTAPHVARVGRVAPEALPRAECAIECIDLIQWFGTRDPQTPPIAECLGLTALPVGQYTVKIAVDVPRAGGRVLTAEQTFWVRDDPLPPAERALVERFVRGSPGAGSTGLAREEYCLKMFPGFRGSRYASYVYYHTGGLMRGISLEQALAAVGAGPGSDARRARLLLHRSKFVPVSTQDLGAVAARYGSAPESPLVRLATRRIERDGTR